jgi:hypothetical protein
MRMVNACRSLALAAFLLVAGPAAAQNCAGFTDVLASDPLCPDIEWIKNRSITLGCNLPGTLYCPAPAVPAPGLVSRREMAAFLKRLSDKITPADLQPIAYTSPGQQNLDTPPILCQTGDYQVLGYPRRAYFNSKVNVWAPSAAVELVVDVMFSLNQGASWVSVQDSQVYQTLRAGQTPPDDVSMYPIGFWDLSVGQQVRFGIRVARQGGTGNPNIYCVNRVQIWNRTSATPPYDEAYAEPPAEERTGRAADRPPQ